MSWDIYRSEKKKDRVFLEERKTLPPLEKRYNIINLPAQYAHIGDKHDTTIDELQISILPLKEKRNNFIEQVGVKAEITDYAVLQGGKFWEEYTTDGLKKYGYYWTNTKVEPSEEERKKLLGTNLKFYKCDKYESFGTFFGYRKGKTIEDVEDSCIIEYTDNNYRTSFYLNLNGNLYNLVPDSAYDAAYEIGSSQSPFSPPPSKLLVEFLTRKAHIGNTQEYISLFREAIKRNKILSQTYQYIAGNGNDTIAKTNSKGIGNRYMLNTYIHGATQVEVQNGIKEIEYAIFPQQAVSKELQKILEKGYNSKKLQPIIPEYMIGGLEYNVEHNYDKLYFQYEGKLYYRVIANINSAYDKVILSNGVSYSNGDAVWVEMSPIELLVSENNMTAITKKILTLGNPDAIHFLFAYELPTICFGNYRRYDDILPNGTDWMRSYQSVKKAYENAGIPFEETEDEVVKRYVELSKKIPIKNQVAYGGNVHKINYIYNPTAEFLNSIEDPVVATMAALGPKDMWIEKYRNELIREYGCAWCVAVITEPTIVKVASDMYDEKLQKAQKYEEAKRLVKSK